MNKGALMKLVFSEDELRNVDSAIPIQLWTSCDTSIHVMDYNDNGAFGKLVNMKELAEERGININA